MLIVELMKRVTILEEESAAWKALDAGNPDTEEHDNAKKPDGEEHC